MPLGFDMAGCVAFIEAVLAAADTAKRERPRARRQALASWLIDRFVPEVRILGVDIRSCIVPGFVSVEGANEAVGWDVGDFRPALTSGGQGDEVLRHLAAAAAAVLMRRRFLVWAASFVDRLQGLSRARRPESRAEVAGNRAGVRVGRHLRAFLRGAITREALDAALRKTLLRSSARSTPQRAR